jgi:hypothetical protein
MPSNYINGADMPTLTCFKMELQRINDIGVDVNPIITEYMKNRIEEIEPNEPTD